VVKCGCLEYVHILQFLSTFNFCHTGIGHYDADRSLLFTLSHVNTDLNYELVSQANKLAGETTTTKPTTSTTKHTSTTTTANKLDTESTPYLIMQQQQKDSSLTKRQHSGALEGFFTVSGYKCCVLCCAWCCGVV